MMSTADLTAALGSIDPTVPVYFGYPDTGALLPYVVYRPTLINNDSVALAGGALVWDVQDYIYCCGASVEASYNIAKQILSTLQGARVGGQVLSLSVGYTGAAVEGHYETQITAQRYQGGIE